jgi:hypothetical protein
MFALFVVALTSWAPSPQDQGALRVTVDLSAIDRATMADENINAAYKGLVLRLIGEGYSVAEPDRGGDIMIEVLPSDEPAKLRIVVSTAAGQEAERVVPISLSADEEAQFRFIHEAVDLVRHAREVLAQARGAPPEPPMPLAPPTAAEQVRQAPAAAAVAARAGSAAMWSGRSLGILATLDGTLIRGRWQVGLGGFLHEPLDLPRALHLFEWGGWLTVGVRRSLAGCFSAQADLSAGFVDQVYRYADTNTASDRGSLWDPLAQARAGMGCSVSPRWRFHLGAGTLLTLHERSHVTPTQRLWHGPQVRPFVGIGVEFLP